MENERGKKGEPARAHRNNSHIVQIKNSRWSNHWEGWERSRYNKSSKVQKPNNEKL